MSQVDKITEAFRIFDTNGDGYIPVNEIPTAIRALGHIVSDVEINTKLRQLGVRGRGVDLNTYRKMIEPLQRTNYAIQLKEAFATIDREASGYVDASELRAILTRIGDKLTDEEFEVVLQELDVDSSGRIRCDDFIYVICSAAK